LIFSVTDERLPSGNWKRKSNSSIITLKSNDEIIKIEKNITFKSIKSDYISKSDTGLPNSNIGVLDLETFEKDSLAYCYAIGFFSSVDEHVKTFYIDRNLNSLMLIHTCISELLRPKYKDIHFYCHNLGGFDAPFIIKALSLFNQTEEGKENPYILDSITRNTSVLKLTIKRKIDGKIRRIVIKDSVAILPGKLRDLCKDFNVKTHKGIFPYSFCNMDTLFYEGQTPGINYYDHLLDDEELLDKDNEAKYKLKLLKYKSIYKNN